MKNNILNRVTWEGNSRKMYQAILNEVPPMFKGKARQEIERWMIQNKITVVTEDTVFQAVNDLLPPKLARGRVFPALERMRSR